MPVSKNRKSHKKAKASRRNRMLQSRIMGKNKMKQFIEEHQKKLEAEMGITMDLQTDKNDDDE